MARIAGVDIPNDKRVVISLTYIYGIGLTTSKKVLEEAGISEDVRVKDLTEEQLNRVFTHQVNGKITVAAKVAKLAWHEEHHLAHIKIALSK